MKRLMSDERLNIGPASRTLGPRIDAQKLYGMVWHYHDDDIAGPGAAVTLELSGLSNVTGAANVTHYRVDENHSNAYQLRQRP